MMIYRWVMAHAAAVLAAAFLTWKEMENDDDDDREFTRFEKKFPKLRHLTAKTKPKA